MLYHNNKLKMNDGVVNDQQYQLETENNKNSLLSQFILGEKLGEGTFGVVRLGTHILTGEKVAIKQIEKSKITQKMERTRIEREIKILKIMHHSNIIQLFSVIQSSTTIDLIMEYASGRELFEYIISKQHLSEIEACRFFQQIISGIEYLNKLRIVHRDIKPENLLLDEKNNIKIVDFGLSNVYSKGNMLLTACGSPCYAAPEMLVGKKYKPGPVDIWASGIVLYAMICGYLPFEDDNSQLLYSKISEGKYTIPDYVSKEGKSMIKRLLTVNPQLRISIEQIKKHPWFNLIRQDTNINEGLFVNLNVIPIDEKIIEQMHKYDYTKEEIRENVVLNKHNHITITYYLLLKKHIRNGISSISDFQSRAFNSYVRSETNLLSKYNNDIELVIKDRKYSRKKIMLDDEKEDKEGDKDEQKTSQITKVNSDIQVNPIQIESSPSSTKRKANKTTKTYSVKNSLRCSPLPSFTKNTPVKKLQTQAYENKRKHHSMCISERKPMKEYSLITKGNEQRLSTQENSSFSHYSNKDLATSHHHRLTTEIIDHIHKVILTKAKKLDFQTFSLLRRNKPIQNYIHLKKNKVSNTITPIKFHHSTMKTDLLKGNKNMQMPLLTNKMKGGYYTNSNSKKKKKKAVLKPNKIIQSSEVYKKEFSSKKDSFNHSLNAPIPLYNDNKDFLISGKNPIDKIKITIKTEEKKLIDKEKKTIQINDRRIIRKLDFNEVNIEKNSSIKTSKRENTQQATENNNSINSRLVDSILPLALSSSTMTNSIGDIKTCISPFDLGCMIYNNIREILDEISKTLAYNSVQFKSTKVIKYLY